MEFEVIFNMSVVFTYIRHQRDGLPYKATIILLFIGQSL